MKNFSYIMSRLLTYIRSYIHAYKTSIILLVLFLSVIECSIIYKREHSRTTTIDDSYENMCSSISISNNTHFEDICRYNLGYARKDMPQFDNITDFSNMKNYLQNYGISYHKNTVKLTDCHITQAEIIRAKVINFPNEYLYSDIVISKDLWVIDGHHRFVANILAGNKIISAIIFNEEIRKLMPLMLQFKFIKTA